MKTYNFHAIAVLQALQKLLPQSATRHAGFSLPFLHLHILSPQCRHAYVYMCLFMI